ncbi:MAG: sigma-70 family RNA polymerase sigma factor [Candidatus Margulisiibacteriota bacterium]
MPAIHFDYQSRRSFRYTYHPPEEVRIERELQQLQATERPLGPRRVLFISRNTKLRIIETLTRAVRISHPRLLKDYHFLIKLPGWKVSLYGFYLFGLNGERPPEQSPVDYLLDRLGVEPFKSPPQPRVFECWEQRSPREHLRLLQSLQSIAKNKKGIPCPHLRALFYPDFSIKLPELGKSLIGLYKYYKSKMPGFYKGKTLDYMLDELGVEQLKDLSRDLQFACIRYHANWYWIDIPNDTVLYLLDRARQEVELPHLRCLQEWPFYHVHLPEIDGKLIGLYEYFRLHTKKSDPRKVIDAMLDHYKVPNYEEKRLPSIPFIKYRRFSLQAPTGGRTFGDKTGDPNLVTPEEAADRKFTLELLLQAIESSNLTQREKEILRRRYNEDQTLEFIADSLGLKREEIRRIEAEALAKIRTRIESR